MATANGTACEAGEATENPLWFVGVLLDAVATLAGTGGKQLLRYAVVTKNPWYYPLGLVCTAVIDPAFDISAYGFAAQSIIAPMAGMVVVWNIMIAPFTLGERLTRSRTIGALLIVIGTLFVGIFGNHKEFKRSVDDYLDLFSSSLALTYYFAFAIFTGACVHFYKHGTPFVSGFSIGALGGALAGNMFTTKAVVEMMKCVATTDADADPCATPCSFNPFLTIWPYLFVTVSLTLACVSLYMLAVGLRHFEALYMITVFEGFMIVSGSLSGNLVMYEMEGQPAHLLALYSLAIGVILVGLFVLLQGESRRNAGRLLTTGMQPSNDPDHHPAQHDAQHPELAHEHATELESADAMRPGGGRDEARHGDEQGDGRAEDKS